MCLLVGETHKGVLPSLPTRWCRPLLLIHGLTDDNVYFQHSAQLSEALFNFLPLLGTHMVSEPLLRLRRQTRIINFFDAELKPRNEIARPRRLELERF